MSAAGALFCDDADFVNVRGSHWHGRDRIESEHAIRHGPQLKGSTFTPLKVEVQPIGADIALVHVRWAMHGDHDLDGTPRQPRRGVFSWVMQRDCQGLWKIRAAQNTHVEAGR